MPDARTRSASKNPSELFFGNSIDFKLLILKNFDNILALGLLLAWCLLVVSCNANCPEWSQMFTPLVHG